MKIISKDTISIQPPRESTTYIIGANLLPNLHCLELLKEKYYSNFLLLFDENIDKLYGNTIRISIQKLDKAVITSIIESGEKSKSLDNLTSIVKPFFDAGFDRNSCLIAAGGGVICDIGGFLASILLRGIDCIYIPTTLLAQVDAAIGGKTAVNFKISDQLILKNMIGTFKQPSLVLSDVDVLKTLPKKEVKNGLGEIVKYWIGWGKPDITENNFSVMLNSFQHPNKIPKQVRDDNNMSKIISICQKIKIDTVKKDPYEQTGERQKLNLGHTIGHAIEGTANGKLSHGEAVAIGLMAAAKISVLKGILNKTTYIKISNIIQSLGLPISISGLDKGDVLQNIKYDKKGGAFVLIKDIGLIESGNEVKEKYIKKAISEVLG